MDTYGPNWGVATLSNKNDRKLFEAVCRGQTGNIRKYLNLGANINAKDKEDGTTPLMKACTRRNYVVQKLLLSCGADPNVKDLRGLTALHYVSESGDLDSMKLLIAYQADIDSFDKFGCTPLHYASNRRHLEASDMLVFCGADAYEEDQWWRTPLSVCRDTHIVDVLERSEMVLNGIKNNDIFIQHVELEQNSTYILENLGLTIVVPDTFKTNSLSFLCRRVRPEFSQPCLRPRGRELLISDTFEYRISTVQINGTVTLKIPLYDFPDPFEDVYMKTDTKPDIDVEEKLTKIHRVRNDINPNELRWYCRATIDITKLRAFNLVTFPKVENFKVGPEGGKFSSKVDKFVHMSVSPDTFEEEGILSLEVIPSPAYRQDIYKDIFSIGHFYDMTYNAEVGYDLDEDVTVLLPVPQYYGGEGHLYLMSARTTSHFYVDDEPADSEEVVELWEILETNPVTRRGKIISQLPHFSICVLTEARKDLSDDDVKIQTDHLLRRASKRKTYVVFFAVIKPIGHDIYDVVVECTTPQKRLERINYWLGKRYLDQTRDLIDEFDAQPGKDFSITLKGNVRQMLTSVEELHLQFHPKRRNYQRLQVTMKNKNQVANGSIYIREIDDHTGQRVPITNIDIHLVGEPFIEDIAPVKGHESDDGSGFKGFTRDKFLLALANLIGEDWIKISLMLGLSYKTIDEIRLQCLQLSFTERTVKVLQHWRDMSMHRLDNYGVPDLMSALQRVGRDDLVDFVLNELHKWLYERKDDRDTFYFWVVETLEGPEKILRSTGALRPEPMSDVFFLVMVAACSEPLEIIGPNMGLSQAEMDSLFNDPMVTSYEHRLLRMLITAREKIGNVPDAFTKLVASLRENKLDQTLSWFVRSCRDWLVEETPDEETPAKQTIEEYLETTTAPQTADSEAQEEYSKHENNLNILKGDSDLKPENGYREKVAKLKFIDEADNENVPNISRPVTVVGVRTLPESQDDYDIPRRRSKSAKLVRWEDPVVKTVKSYQDHDPESD